MNKQLIILGFHRSGTSLLAQILDQAGLFIGDKLLPPALSNADGHFEDYDFFSLHEKILKYNKSSWMFHDEVNLVVPDFYLHRMQTLVKQRNQKHKLWGFKDPRTALFIDKWHDTLDNPYYVVIYRSYIECVNSLLYRASQNILYYKSQDISFWKKPELAYRMWLSYNQQLIKFIQQHKERTIVISHQSLINQYPIVDTINQKFNLHLTPTNSSLVKKELLTNKQIHSIEPAPSLKQKLDSVWESLEKYSLTPTFPSIEPAKEESSTIDILTTLQQIGLNSNIQIELDVIASKLKKSDLPIAKKIETILKKRPLFLEMYRVDDLIEVVETLAQKHYHTELYFILSELYFSKKEFNKSEHSILKAFSIADTIYPYFYQKLATVYLAYAKHEKALYFINRALKGNPNNPLFYSTHAQILKEVYRLREALEQIDKAIALQKDNASFYHDKVLILYEIGDIHSVEVLLDFMQNSFEESAKLVSNLKKQLLTKQKIKQDELLKEIKGTLFKDNKSAYRIINLLNSISDSNAKKDLIKRVLEHFLFLR